MDMRTCPECGGQPLRSVEGTRGFMCEGCGFSVVHEGNGFVSEMV